MKCPYCNAEDTRVIDSRPADDNTAIRRRRQCESCGKRFTTFEKLETTPILIVKKDQSRVPYDRSKIEAGIIRSCHKRPVSRDTITRMVDEVENALFASGENELSTEVIGELVMEKLKEVDQVAYVRFASVYREFKDINTFVEEIGKLLRGREMQTEEG
ncbi:MAG: transcriptional regulator NrdR [Oribacterium sp.]